MRAGYNLEYTYDNLGRVSTFIHSDNGVTTSYVYNLVSQVTQMNRSNSAGNAYSYDALGRLVTEGQQFGLASYLYDAAGDRTQITWGDGFYVSYAYDMIGGVTGITEHAPSSAAYTLATYNYDNLGRRLNVAYGNGTGRSYVYDPVGRLASLQLVFPNNASYPNNTSYNQTINGSCTFGASNTPTICYTPSSQIASITRSNDAYAWTGSYNVNRSYTTNGLNQFTNSGGTALGYDANGNLNQSGSTTYGYGYNNLLCCLSSGEEIGHDPANRISQFYWSPSNVTEFYYAGSDLIAEYTTGPITNRYVPGPGTDEPLVWYQGSGNSSRNFLQADERGSIIAISNSAGGATNVNSYDEFGIPAASNVGRYQYTGQLWSSDVGMYWYKARWYSPTLGRFMQTDPIGYGDGLNFYNYAHSDPINGSDPTGTDDFDYTNDPSILGDLGDLLGVLDLGAGSGDNGCTYSNVTCSSSLSSDSDGTAVITVSARVNPNSSNSGTGSFDSSSFDGQPSGSNVGGGGALPGGRAPQSGRTPCHWSAVDRLTIGLDGVGLGASVVGAAATGAAIVGGTAVAAALAPVLAGAAAAGAVAATGSFLLSSFGNSNSNLAYGAGGIAGIGLSFVDGTAKGISRLVPGLGAIASGALLYRDLNSASCQ